jgi:thymidylate synthase
MDGKRFEGIVRELLWFLKGSTNCRELEEYNVPIWSAWADKDGGLGPIYGKQWRAWETYQAAGVVDDAGDGCELFARTAPIDQIANLVRDLKENPDSRRHIVSAWNVADISDMALPPCHYTFECYVANKTHLDLKLNQRSCDLMLGAPYNLASYSLLQILLCQVTGLLPRYFIHSIGDAHIYQNHVDGAKLQLSREPFSPPSITFTSRQDIDDFVYEDFQLINYQCHPGIKFDVAV